MSCSSQELPALDTGSQIKTWIRRIYDGVMGVRPFAELAPYSEGSGDWHNYQEVVNAFSGRTATAERVDDQNRLILSVAVPIQRVRAVSGVLFVTTEGGDIDDILRQERFTLIEVFLVAFAVMLVTSLYLASTIAEPVKRLAAAADIVRSGAGGRSDIPNFPERTDEIGDLADSLRSMTGNLYDRIDAIESFAADVAHELKNPLTSLASAVEMFSRAKDAESQARLLQIVRGDIKRIDRLITDISDASRLDAELSRETKEPVELSRLLATIIDIYRMTDNPRHVEFVLHDELPPGMVVRGRDERLGQVFRNLIDNAASFSPDGGKVIVTASQERHHRAGDDGRRRPRHSAGESGIHLRAFLYDRAARRPFRPQFGAGPFHRPPDHRRRGRAHLCREPRPGGPARRRRAAGGGIAAGAPMAEVNIHASCVALGAQGVLLLGKPGAGKSDLALRLIDEGGRLVADDRTILFTRRGGLYGKSPASIRGLMEIRGLGIVQLDRPARM